MNQDITSSYYAQTAYRGSLTRIPLEKQTIKRPTQFDTFKPIILNPIISGNDYIASSNGFDVNDYDTLVEQEKKTNKWMRMGKYSKSCHEREKHSSEHEYIAPSGFNLAAKLFFLAAAGYVMFFLGLFVFPLVSILVFWWGDTHTWQDAWSGIEFTIISLLACFIAWKLLLWLSDRCPNNNWKYLNRRTGMLVIPRFGNKPPLEIPFAELVPCMQWVSTSSGTSRHLLAYIHPPTGKGIYAGASTIADVYLRAAYLEQFMDVTQPLPDVPKLEPFRLSDPVTAEYDKANGRNPRFWRDKTKEEIDMIVKTRQKEIENIIGQGSYSL